MADVIRVEGLRKRYGEVRAVDGISFAVREGEVFGLVGPNGAGKTTTLEILEGLRPADEGSVQVAGIDARREPRRLREHIGVQLQATALFERLTVTETLELFGALYPRRLPPSELLRTVHLEEKADEWTERLSGGQRQRLAVALALVNDPRVVFLDEPTTGLDPQARRSLWDVVSRMRGTGKTILLTTHYMEEAERLCDRVGVVDHGKLLALDTPRNLVLSLGERHAVEFSGGRPEDFAALPGVEEHRAEDGHVVLYTRELERTVGAVFEKARRENLAIEGFRVRNPSLDDVFIQLTGRRIRE
jgi:ABC-2 type transport system ATP-binding protein